MSCSWGSDKRLRNLLLTLLKQTSRPNRRGAEQEPESVWRTICILPCMTYLRYGTSVTSVGQCGIFCCWAWHILLLHVLLFEIWTAALQKESVKRTVYILCNRGKKIQCYSWGGGGGVAEVTLEIVSLPLYIRVFRTIVHRESALINPVDNLSAVKMVQKNYSQLGSQSFFRYLKIRKTQ